MNLPMAGISDAANWDPNTPLRMYLALKMLRAWNMDRNYDGRVVMVVRQWLDDGLKGPIPWPGGAFFEEWAHKEGLSNVDGSVGFYLTGIIDPQLW